MPDKDVSFIAPFGVVNLDIINEVRTNKIWERRKIIRKQYVLKLAANELVSLLRPELLQSIIEDLIVINIKFEMFQYLYIRLFRFFVDKMIHISHYAHWMRTKITFGLSCWLTRIVAATFKISTINSTA